ncbi:MAG: hypothetical protein K0R58_4056, partial [Ramlibacter sp.]|nr:hypothetical protein [Ramlibacter sp.]
MDRWWRLLLLLLCTCTGMAQAAITL